MSTRQNPFSLTQAIDLTDEQIQTLWVDIGKPAHGDSLVKLARMSSPMPTFILGGKGSGKTHLMRYCSFPLQKLRWDKQGKNIIDGLIEDSYLGIYSRCSGLNAGRFRGKGQPQEAWSEIFSYYIELWTAQALLRLLPAIIADAGEPALEARLCEAMNCLFDKDPPHERTIAAVAADIAARQRKLDFEVNNAAFTGELRPEISVTRGRMSFGIPKLIVEHIKPLSGIVFSYQLDEFEHLGDDQQQHINTLLREREPPTTFKIGARQFGVKTHRTFSDNEENIKDSEFEELRLDQRFRQNEPAYRDLARRLIDRRLQSMAGTRALGGRKPQELDHWFKRPESGWDAAFFLQLVQDRPSDDRRHFRELRKKLALGLDQDFAPGVSSAAAIDRIVHLLAVPSAPLLEKVNILLLYGAWAKGKNLSAEAKSVAAACKKFMAGAKPPQYGTKLGHYKSDMVAQLLRENTGRQGYAGLATFIRMSEGQPRALITLLKQVYDWAEFEGHAPFVEGRITLGAQSKGAVAASEWFYNSMMKAGHRGRDILEATSRLAELFRINRYSDNPLECSLIGFSANLFDANLQASEVISLATDRSFLVEIDGGQSERNSERVTTKLQLNRMLVPRWGLPTGRRGVGTFGPRELNAIFDPSQGEEFKALSQEWLERRSAPFFGRRRRLASAEVAETEQSDLFKAGVG